LEQESRKLADAEVDVIVFAATAPTLAKGKGYDRELIKRMEDAGGRPATTAATAFVDALTRLGVTKIAIGAPWSKTMDKPMVEFMEASGFEVVHSEVVGFVAAIELGRVGPQTAYDLARRTDRPEAQAIVMPGGNWASMPVVDQLECFSLISHHEVIRYREPARDLAQLVARLSEADVIVSIRERVEFSRALLERLPKLKLIALVGRNSKIIDFAACTELGIPV